MHSRETRVLLRHYLEQGVSKDELAKRFGISRRTVLPLDRDGAVGSGLGQRGGPLPSPAARADAVGSV